jgi:hypothetical protein
MGRVFIGADEDQIVGADDEQVLSQLFGSQVSGDDDYQIVGGDDEIVGGDEVGGDEVGGDEVGYDEIVGADVRPRPQAASQKLVYDQWLPLTGSAGISIAAGASYELELKPQRLFRPGKLTLTVVAQVLDLTACAIGQENQFVASGAIPGEFFKADAVGKELKSQTAGPGVSIMLTFVNPTNAAVVLKGGWAGNSVVR